MLIAHKIIDALEGRDKGIEVDWIPGSMTMTECVSGLKQAQKFDFGDLPFERLPDTTWAAPNLTVDERGFWRDGLIPLPFPVCWFEFVLGGFRSGLLVCDTVASKFLKHPNYFDGWILSRVDLAHNTVAYDGMTVSAKFSGMTDQHLACEIQGDPRWIERMKHRRIGNDTMAVHGAINMQLAIYLCLMLNSKTTEMRDEVPPPKLNKARVKRGKTPLESHRVVTIVPRRFRYERVTTEGGQTIERACPRLHWRRSHKRHYDHPVPTAKWVPDEMHNGTKGWYVSIIARQLVGRAELGEVSHEYFIPVSNQSTLRKETP
jgi:hypothetical protein